MMLQFRPASRKAVPQLISISGKSGDGKTFSALLVAAGLAGPKGRVGMIDTENGRGEMYTDSPGIRAALPDSFDYLRIDPPFPPSAYIESIQAAEKAGLSVVVIDSTSHEWEGEGGCCDIAEKNKLRGMPNWAKAKLEHKRFVNHCLSSQLHIIFCLRARDKTKIMKNSKGQDEFVSQGLQPITEKNFEYEMLLSFRLESETRLAVPLKCPQGLLAAFQKPHLLTKEDGDSIRKWNEAGAAFDSTEQLQKRARMAAEGGLEAYQKFFFSLGKPDQKILKETTQEANKARAIEADKEIAEASVSDGSEESPLDVLRGKISALINEPFWHEVMGKFGKAGVAHIIDELSAEDILGEMRARQRPTADAA